jgi:RimJ/RimL family protein N-acetyltransferase
VGHSLGRGAVRLRVPARDDLAFIRQLWSDAPTMAPVGGPVVLSDEDWELWFARYIQPGSPDRAYWLVISQGRPVGEIGFGQFDGAERAAMLNLKIAAGQRGRGYARLALQALLQYYFEDLGGARMVDDVATGNIGGQMLLLSEGFVRDPDVTDVCRLVLTAEQWRTRSGAAR